MASKSTMTVPQQESCVKLLRALRETGQLENLLEMASRVPMPSSSSGGSMHDGSKRRLVAEDVSSVSSFEFLEEFDPEECLPMPSLQMPVKVGYPKAKIPYRTDDCPPGIESMAKWSRNICDLPKVRKMGLSYFELVEASAKNEDIKQYLEWALLHPHVSPKVKDLHDYLIAIEFDIPAGVVDGTTYFPGGKDVRRFK